MKPKFAVTRRRFLQASGGAMALAASADTSPPSTMPKRGTPPNILFLMADQHRGDCVGADGNPVIQTPNLDRLAAEGALFRAAYSSTPTCTPARAALLTGMSPWNHGVLGAGKVGRAYPVEMPRVLRDAGYHTLGIGKMHWDHQRTLHGFHKTILDESGRELSEDFRSDYRAWFASVAPDSDPDATGIDFNSFRAAPYHLPEELHPTRWTADVAVRFLQQYRQPKPFFLKVSFARPHSPYDPPKRWMDAYENADLPRAEVGEWAALRYRAENRPGETTIWRGDLGSAQVRYARQGYYGSVSFIDEQIGRIVETLNARGLLENTLIVYTSDHGDMTGDHHLWRKSYAYEPSARIPMIVRWPENLVSAKRGQVRTEPVELRDILATFCDAAGTKTPQPIEGRSMLDPIRGNTSGWREWIDLEHDICYDRTNHWSALTDGKWKYIFHAFDGSEQLFHLENDPHELRDLTGDETHSGTLETWRNRLVAHLEPRGAEWVRDGRLVPRPKSTRFSPNYPVTPEKSAAKK